MHVRGAMAVLRACPSSRLNDSVPVETRQASEETVGYVARILHGAQQWPSTCRVMRTPKGNAAIPTHLQSVHEIPARERLAGAVEIADLVTALRKRASGKGVGTSDGTHSGCEGARPATTRGGTDFVLMAVGKVLLASRTRPALKPRPSVRSK
jgi:hypothetical protein